MNSDRKIGADEFALGPVRLHGLALLAPLSGVTDVHMRRIAMAFGAGAVVSEMVASDEFARGSEEARLRAEGRGIDPHIVQLAGCDPSWMAEAARLAEANGAQVIDINMGCPAKRVTGGWAGSALMRDLDHAERLIAAVVGAVAVPVTVKMRLGWDHASIVAPALAARAQRAGVAAVTVHGRTRQQFYKGSADWEAIRPVVEAVDVPVVANGDVVDDRTARACLDRSGAAAVMIGRAALGRPWLVGSVAATLAGKTPREPSPEEKTQAVAEHYEGILALYGSHVGVRHARKHLAAYADEAARCGFAVPARERETLVTSDDPAIVLGILRRLFARPVSEAA